MIKGIVFILGACLIWGLIYVIPPIISGFTSFEIVLGRYIMYGMLSSIFFYRSKVRNSFKFPKMIWKKAFVFSLIITIIYYSFVVLGLKYSSPAICTLILGVGPIAIAFWGNFKEKEIAYKKLFIPSILIILGLIIINGQYFNKVESIYHYILGIIFTILALIAWTWYVVANSRFQKNHPELLASNWSTILGMATFFWAIIFGIFLFLFFPSQFNVSKYFVFNNELATFLIGSAILGFACSWMGAYLWNKGCVYLPVSLAGQLTIFETIFGVVLVYIAQKYTPSGIEILGVLILIGAIIYGIKQFSKKKNLDDEFTN